MEERKALFYGVRRGGISVNVMEWDGYKNPVLVVGLEDENVHCFSCHFDFPVDEHGNAYRRAE